MNSEHWRDLTRHEQKLIDKLLSVPFPGRDELLAQLAGARVRSIDDDGSLEFKVSTGSRANVSGRVPVDGRVADADGVQVEILLHVVDGRLNELEIYKVDGSPIIKQPVEAPDPSSVNTY